MDRTKTTDRTTDKTRASGGAKTTKKSAVCGILGSGKTQFCESGEPFGGTWFCRLAQSAACGLPIYSEQRYPACRGISRRAKHRAVAAEYHGEIGHRRDIADLDTAAARGKDIAYLLGITAVAVLCLIRNQYNIFYLHRIPP